MYDPKRDSLVISTKEAKRAAYFLRHAIKHVRLMAGLPLTGYTKECGPMDSPHFAENSILDAAEALGIDMARGDAMYGSLDVSKE